MLVKTIKVSTSSRNLLAEMVGLLFGLGVKKLLGGIVEGACLCLSVCAAYAMLECFLL